MKLVQSHKRRLFVVHVLGVGFFVGGNDSNHVIEKMEMNHACSFAKKLNVT